MFYSITKTSYDSTFRKERRDIGGKLTTTIDEISTSTNDTKGSTEAAACCNGILSTWILGVERRRRRGVRDHDG